MLRYTIIGVAVVATALAGCSSAKDKPSADSLKGAATSIVAAAPNAPKAQIDQTPAAVTSPKGKAKITIDGKTLKLTGPVKCAAMGGASYLMVGDDPQKSVAAVQMTGDTSLKVNQVSIMTDGAVLVVEKSVGGSATATKRGNAYSVKGTGQYVDMGSGDTGEKDFTIDATCPDDSGDGDGS